MILKILLDTCTFLWWATGSATLPQPMQEVLRDPANQVFLSAASAWEIVIKHALRRLPLPAPPDDWVPDRRARLGIEALPIEEGDTLHVAKLSHLHHDPFDRMLVAQAIVRGLQIATPDPAIRAYPAATMWPAQTT